jgi:hypothetical protein
VLTPDEFQYWNDRTSPDELRLILQERVSEACHEWTPLLPMTEEALGKITDEHVRARVRVQAEARRQEWQDMQDVCRGLFRRRAEQFDVNQGVIHAPGLVNDPAVAAARNRTVEFSEAESNAMRASQLTKYKVLELRNFLISIEQATSGIKGQLILRLINLGYSFPLPAPGTPPPPGGHRQPPVQQQPAPPVQQQQPAPPVQQQHALMAQLLQQLMQPQQLQHPLNPVLLQQLLQAVAQQPQQQALVAQQQREEAEALVAQQQQAFVAQQQREEAEALVAQQPQALVAQQQREEAEALMAQQQHAEAFVTDLPLWKRRRVGRGGDEVMCGCGCGQTCGLGAMTLCRGCSRTHVIKTCNGRWLCQNCID